MLKINDAVSPAVTSHYCIGQEYEANPIKVINCAEVNRLSAIHFEVRFLLILTLDVPRL